MIRHVILYGVFCLAVVGLFMLTASDGYSPFSTGGARPMSHAFYGPTHK
ncbi:MAG TPA: hypothetical protein VK980_10895 [Sphingomonas sp.]|jgi:hypothetical protein|nr:hypothetical protein [Sphingomonas bacterium]MDB5708304.1 hypothetical protein [Sphingomonas bacterium]HSI18268.1 hypothetical protein [Sphingomonas sp.]